MHKDVCELNRHKEKQHTSYQCDVCRYKTNMNTEYETHMLTHVKDTFSCEVCEKKGNSQNEIDEHIQKIHVKEMFQHFVKNKKKHEERRPKVRFQESTSESADTYSY